MINLELRKQALEALGWRFCDRGDYRTAFDPNDDEHGRSGRADFSYTLSVCPAIEHDPAVSEPLFLEWCAKNSLAWEMGCSNGRTIWLAVADAGTRLDDSCNPTLVEGPDPCEARARAIVATSQVEGK